MEIKGIKKLKNGQYKILLDEDKKIITYDDVILKNHLLYDKEIDNELLNKISNDTVYYDAYNKTIECIAKRMRSLKEVSNYLSKFNLGESKNKEIIENLIKIGLLNDKAFAKAYLNDRFNLSNFGPEKIKEELLSHEISETLIDELLLNIDYNDIKEKLIHLMEKKVRLNHKLSNYSLKQKLTIDFINLGFSKEVVIDALSSITFGSNDILESTYQKIYLKLSKKFSGKDLLYKIKQKLYQMGFDINEINELLNKNNFDE